MVIKKAKTRAAMVKTLRNIRKEKSESFMDYP
jgi:hypothetical protein